MRKNKLTGAIPGAGRPKGDTQTEVLNVRISREAKAVLKQLPRMERGKFVEQAILKANEENR